MIYDVTLPLSPMLAAWPGDPAVTCETFGDRVRVSRWTLGSHAGTHVDAPAHFSAGRTVDALDPAVLLGPCRVLDLTDCPRITAAVLHAHALTGVMRLLLRTRNSAHWTQCPSNFNPDYVSLTIDAAQALLTLGVRLVGVDGLSIEAPDATQAHELLLGAGVILVEGLHLAAVPAGDYHLVCAPLKLAGADGAPARVFLVAD